MLSFYRQSYHWITLSTRPLFFLDDLGLFPWRPWLSCSHPTRFIGQLDYGSPVGVPTGTLRFGLIIHPTRSSAQCSVGYWIMAIHGGPAILSLLSISISYSPLSPPFHLLPYPTRRTFLISDTFSRNSFKDHSWDYFLRRARQTDVETARGSA